MNCAWESLPQMILKMRILRKLLSLPEPVVHAYCMMTSHGKLDS